jgi:hypothetical protein
MKSSDFAAIIMGALALDVAPPASASWLSDITGINIDVPAEKFEIGTPNLAAIPQMLQHLPQDAANFFLSPGSSPLAFLIRQTEASAASSAQPIPADIRQLLAPYFPTEILESARWTTADQSGITLAAELERANGDIGAVTANNIIVFRGPTEAGEFSLWAHELVHVSQYRNMGIEGFAAMYAGWGAQRIEGDAYAWQNHVTQEVQMMLASRNVQGNNGPFPNRAPQWIVRGPGARAMTWQDFHEAALRTIPPRHCIEGGNVDSRTLDLHNICPIGVVITRVHVGPDAFPCALTTCFYPAGDRHNLRARWPLDWKARAVEFQFTEVQPDNLENPDDEDDPE